MKAATHDTEPYLDPKSFFYENQSFEELSLSIYKLEQLAFSKDTPIWPNNCLTTCNTIYSNWEKKLEERHAGNKTKHWKEYPLYDRFRRLIQRERLLIQEITPQKILFIGGGPFPISALIYWDDYGLQSTCIDEDPMACRRASNLINSLGLSDKIEILSGKGQSVDLELYDLVIVSLLALPKKEILKNIQQKIHANTQVICRTSEKARTLLYKPVYPSDLSDWKISKKATACSDDTISSLLLENTILRTQYA